MDKQPPAIPETTLPIGDVSDNNSSSQKTTSLVLQEEVRQLLMNQGHPLAVRRDTSDAIDLSHDPFARYFADKKKTGVVSNEISSPHVQSDDRRANASQTLDLSLDHKVKPTVRPDDETAHKSTHKPTDKPSDKPSDKPANKPDASGESEHNKLIAEAEQKYKNDPAALNKFEADMNTFEQRMAKNPGEIDKTYAQLEKLLKGPSKVLSNDARLEVASEAMHQAANPTEVQQGLNNCCVSGSLEIRAYTKSPAEAVALVTEAAMTGAFTTQDGRHIVLDKSTFAKHDTETNAEGESLGMKPRSFASQIFQATVNDIYCNDVDKNSNPKAHHVYRSVPRTIDNPSGEVLQNLLPPHDSTVFQGLPEDESVLNGIYQAIAGKSEHATVLNPMDCPTKEAFLARLAQAQKDGDFPITIAVNLSREPFKSQMDENGNYGGHAITIEGYDPKTGKIQYGNTAIDSQTYNIDADRMFHAMFPELNSADREQLAQQTAQGIKDSKETGRALGQDVAEILTMIAPEDRRAFLEELEKDSGMQLRKLLTPEEIATLQIEERPFISRVFHSVGTIFN